MDINVTQGYVRKYTHNKMLRLMSLICPNDRRNENTLHFLLFWITLDMCHTSVLHPCTFIRPLLNQADAKFRLHGISSFIARSGRSKGSGWASPLYGISRFLQSKFRLHSVSSFIARPGRRRVAGGHNKPPSSLLDYLCG